MTKLRYLVIIAAVANLLSFLLFNYAASKPGGSSVAMVFTIIWLPALWLSAILITGIVLAVHRKDLLRKPTLKWALMASFFCTPVPAILVSALMNKKGELHMCMINTRFENGKTYRTEEWIRTSTGKLFAIKHFVAIDQEKLYMKEKAFKKDSLWAYYDEQGDTLFTERYANDQLMATFQNKSK